MSNNFKLNFAIVGAQKAGTSATKLYLRTYGKNIIMSKKETKFFSINNLYSKGLNYYSSLFDTSNISNLIFGEKDPSYCIVKPALNRLKKHNQNIKIIIILREPIARAYSAHNMDIQDGLTDESFSKVIRKKVKNDGLANKVKKFYIERGFYINQLKYIEKTFGKENIKIYIQEQMLLNPHVYYTEIFEFIGAKYVPEKEREIIINHKRKYESSISQKDKQFLKDLYKPYNELLFDLLGYEIKEWQQ